MSCSQDVAFDADGRLLWFAQARVVDCSGEAAELLSGRATLDITWQYLGRNGPADMLEVGDVVWSVELNTESPNGDILDVTADGMLYTFGLQSRQW